MGEQSYLPLGTERDNLCRALSTGAGMEQALNAAIIRKEED